MMKIKLLSLALAAAVAAPGLAWANTVNFEGEIVTSTCSISMTGGAYTATLGKVDASGLDAADKEAGAANVPVTITCATAAGEQLGVQFSSARANPLTNNLPVETGAGAATNVEIVLYNDDNVPVPFNLAPVKWITASNGSTTLNHIARYKAHGGPANAGQAKATATVTLMHR